MTTSSLLGIKKYSVQLSSVFGSHNLDFSPFCIMVFFHVKKEYENSED